MVYLVPMMGDRRAALIVFLVLCSLLVSLPNIAAVRATEDSWTTLEPLPTIRRDLGVAVVNGKIYAIGGRNDGNYLSTNEEYDPETNTWSSGRQMPTARHSLGVAVMDDELYAIGGGSTNLNVRQYDENERYTPIGYIPEFPSWTALILTVVVVLAVGVIYRRRLAKNQGRADK